MGRISRPSPSTTTVSSERVTVMSLEPPAPEEMVSRSKYVRERSSAPCLEGAPIRRPSTMIPLGKRNKHFDAQRKGNSVFFVSASTHNQKALKHHLRGPKYSSVVFNVDSYFVDSISLKMLKHLHC